MRLIDQYGNPLQLSSLYQPQTARVALLQNLYLDSHMDGITPARAARVLREADNGDITAQHQLFDDMIDRDPHLSCEFGKRTGALLGIDWNIVPPEDASAAEIDAARWVEALLRDAVDNLDDTLAALMDAVGHGFAAVEIEWQRWNK